MIQELKKHLESVGKTDTWLNLAIQFNILPNGSNKQRSDKVRRIYNSIPEKKSGLYNPANITTTSTGNSVVWSKELNSYVLGDFMIKSYSPELDERKSKEWEEFNKWKESKVDAKISTHKSQDGMHIVLRMLPLPL